MIKLPDAAGFDMNRGNSIVSYHFLSKQCQRSMAPVTSHTRGLSWVSFSLHVCTIIKVWLCSCIEATYDKTVLWSYHNQMWIWLGLWLYHVADAWPPLTSKSICLIIRLFCILYSKIPQQHKVRQYYRGLHGIILVQATLFWLWWLLVHNGVTTRMSSTTKATDFSQNFVYQNIFIFQT